MQALEKQVESKIQFWSLVGPCCILFSILFLSIRPDANDLYLPYASLIGIPLCWKWKLRGLAMSLGILGGLVVYHWSSIPPDEMLWECGICLTFALGFLVTALSYDEATAPIKAFQAQTEAQALEVIQLRERLQTFSDTAQSYEQLVGLAREELLSLSRENENIKREFIEQRQALERSTEISLDTYKQDQAHQLKVYYDNERKTNALLKQTQEKLEQAFAELRAVEEAATAAQQQNQKHITSLEAEKAKLLEEIQQRAHAQERAQNSYEDLSKQLHAQIEESLHILNETRQALALAEDNIKESKNQQTPTSEVECPSEDLRRYEGLYKQLREQFEEKSQTLDDTRRALFLAEEQLEQLKRDMLEQSVFSTSETEKKLEKHILRMERAFAKKEQLLQKEIESLQEVISGLVSSK